jgi:hypothetical protein
MIGCGDTFSPSGGGGMGHQNNFDSQRLFAACEVVFTHGFGHLHLPYPSVLNKRPERLPVLGVAAVCRVRRVIHAGRAVLGAGYPAETQAMPRRDQIQ